MQKGKKIALCGPYADSRMLLDIWKCEGQEKECVSLADGLRGRADVCVAGGCEWKEEKEALVPCMGTLLNKRKKDPRMGYKQGETGYFRENSLNAEFYRTYLRDTFGIRRYEWESCGYRQKFPEGKNSIHVQFYQTNTSQYCPLYAVCKYGERGRQELPVNCPEYCSKQVFLYPKHLNMVGRYNSLFALDERAFLRKENVSRIVVNLL